MKNWYLGKFLLRDEDKDKLKQAAVETREREEKRALDGMMRELPLVPFEKAEVSQLFSAAMFAAKWTMRDENERRVFIQDFAAALNRRGLLRNEDVDEFMRYGYIYMG